MPPWPIALQTVTLELAALMNRAKELLGVNDTQALSQLAAAAATQPINERTKLMNVPEDQEMRVRRRALAAFSCNSGML